MSKTLIRKLGRITSRHDPRTLRLARYLDVSALPPVPAAWVGWRAKVSGWGMFANDVFGCCTFSALGHAIQTWTANDGIETAPADADVVAAYKHATGGYCLWGNIPNPLWRDSGCQMLDALKYARANGIGTHKIGAYVSVNLHVPAELLAARYLFGGLYLGLNLPISVQGKETWDGADTTCNGIPGSWGGHATWWPARANTLVTWNTDQPFTDDFFARYCDEAWAILSPDWLGGDMESPCGFDLAQLTADLADINSGAAS